MPLDRQDSLRDPAAPTDQEIRQLGRRLATAATALLIVLAIGGFGYRALAPGTSWIDAIYMTFITLTTVGFGEVVDLSGNPAGRVFTMLLLLSGLGIAAYVATTITAMIVEGHLHRRNADGAAGERPHPHRQPRDRARNGSEDAARRRQRRRDARADRRDAHGLRARATDGRELPRPDAARRDRNLRVSELTLEPDSPALGRRLDEVRPTEGSASLLLACRHADGSWTYNPPGTLELERGVTLVVMGSPADLAVIESNLRKGKPVAAG